MSVVRPDELGTSEAHVWARLQRSSPKTLKPFFSLAFAKAVGSARPSARVAVVEVDGVIEAFLPFERGEDDVAIPIGSPMNDLQGFVTSGAPIDARAVLRQAGLRAWRFEHAPTDQAVLAPHHYPGTVIDCPVIDLTEGFANYFQTVTSRGRSVISKSPKQRRSLERAAGPVHLEWNSHRLSDLHRLFAWKSRRYAHTRTLVEERTTLPILEALAFAEDELCRGKVSVLYAGDRPVAVDLGLLGPFDLCGWFTGYDDEMSRFSPGTIMLLALAEAAAALGVPRFDLGFGQHRYKFLLASETYPLAGGVVWARRSEALARHLYRRLLFEPLVRPLLDRRLPDPVNR